MKKLSLVLLAGLMLATSLPVAADPHRHDQGRHGPPPRMERHQPPHRHHYDNRLAWGVGALALGGLLWSIEAQRPPVVAPVYVAPPVTPPRGVWYYCDAYGAYYPYVGQCPGGWRAVPAY